MPKRQPLADDYNWSKLYGSLARVLAQEAVKPAEKGFVCLIKVVEDLTEAHKAELQKFELNHIVEQLYTARLSANEIKQLSNKPVVVSITERSLMTALQSHSAASAKKAKTSQTSQSAKAATAKTTVTDSEILSAFVRKFWKSTSGISCLGFNAFSIQVVVGTIEQASALPAEFTYKGTTKSVSVFTGSGDIAASDSIRRLVSVPKLGEIL